MSRALRSLPVVLGVALLVALAPTAAFASGELDTTFGSGGQVSRFGSGADDYQGYRSARQADGKILVVGPANAEPTGARVFSVTRFNANGTLDTGFGSSGSAYADFGYVYGYPGGVNGEAYSVIVRTDGKIVVAGALYTTLSGYSYGLARFTSSGVLDSTFGTGGKVKGATGSGNAFYAAVGQPDGKIVAVGGSSTGALIAWRFNANGTLDGSWGFGGKASALFASPAYALDAVLQPDGKVLAVGLAGNDAVMARFTTSGGADSTFGATGTRTALIPGFQIQSNRVVLAPDGRFFTSMTAKNTLAGAGSDILVARYKANGKSDVVFGPGGFVVNDVSAYDSAGAVALQADGKLVVAGASASSPSLLYADIFTVLRLKSKGTPDLSFGTNGVVKLPAFAGADHGAVGFDVLVQADAKILVVGSGFSGGFRQAIVLARLLS